MRINNGGPAFPSEQGDRQDGTRNLTYGAGMTLRDWFAGQAMAGLTVNYFHGSTNFDDMVLAAYQIADAMLRARDPNKAKEQSNEARP